MILRNLVRQRIRTGLTLLGISVGITTVDETVTAAEPGALAQ